MRRITIKPSSDLYLSKAIRRKPLVICHDEDGDFPPYVVFQDLDFRQYSRVKFLNGLTVTGEQFQRFINKLEGGVIHILGSGIEILDTEKLFLNYQEEENSSKGGESDGK
ncbi:MAG TPA: hypothetical protein PKK59_10915 [Anaerolineaceae bacterium]|nr:hypothetical protein [Anaerolineaceae bacterium]